MLTHAEQRKIKTPELDSFSHWPEKPYRWMLSGLIRTIEKVDGDDINYLIALGLVCYTEVIGHEIRKFKQLPSGLKYSKISFDTFLGEYMGYRDLLGKYPIYDWCRCGLCHEFMIKNTDGGKKLDRFIFLLVMKKRKKLLEIYLMLMYRKVLLLPQMV